MNGINSLLDTNIGLLKGNDQVITVLSGISLSACGFSGITRMELLSYPSLATDEEQAINRLLARMTYLSISPLIEDLTIQFRQSHRVKLKTMIDHNLQWLPPESYPDEELDIKSLLVYQLFTPIISNFSLVTGRLIFQ